MAQVHPFRALRPERFYAAEVAAPPYDVLSAAESREIAKIAPESFIRVIRSEVDFSETQDPYAPEVYQRARDNLVSAADRETFLRDESPSLYIYRLRMDGREQNGVVALCSLDEYDRREIKIHEHTRPEKEQDRVRHILATQSQAEPVFLAYRRNETIAKLVEIAKDQPALYDFTLEDGVRHTLWRVSETDALVRAFSEIAPLYIADGHHRSASASIVRRELAQVNAAHTGDESYNGLLSVIFPHDELRIMPYNRVILESPLSDDEILSRLRNSFSIEKAQDGVPAASGEFRLFLGGSWFSMRAIAAPKAQSRGDALDVSVLQSLALEPVFGIRDPRTDKKIDFVGGIRGTAELEKRVRDGSARCAFSLFPVGMEDLFGIADGGEIMPPKSTWFEPKLRSGVVVHSFLKDLRNDADYERFATTGNPT